jgi:hypothetical protein
MMIDPGAGKTFVPSFSAIERCIVRCLHLWPQFCGESCTECLRKFLPSVHDTQHLWYGPSIALRIIIIALAHSSYHFYGCAQAIIRLSNDSQ